MQNLAEAEYCVATFMYMRLLGYPADKITILTTYNGQKHLLRDVVAQRCGDNPFIGELLHVTFCVCFVPVKGGCGCNIGRHLIRDFTSLKNDIRVKNKILAQPEYQILLDLK